MFIKKEKKNYKIELSQRFKTSFLEFLRLNCIINCVKENTTKTYHFNTEDFSRRWYNHIKRITIFLILHNIYFLKKTVADHNSNQFFPAIIFFFNCMYSVYYYRVTHECWMCILIFLLEKSTEALGQRGVGGCSDFINRCKHRSTLGTVKRNHFALAETCYSFLTC